MSESTKGRERAWKGKKFTPEHRANLSKAQKNRKLSPEALAAIAEGIRKHWDLYWKQHPEKKRRIPKGYSRMKKGGRLPEQWNKNVTAGKLRS